MAYMLLVFWVYVYKGEEENKKIQLEMSVKYEQIKE